MTAPRGGHLLVLTALDAADAPSDATFLGPWCHAGRTRAEMLGLSGRTLPFHWEDRTKLARDYEYLEDLHGRLLGSLRRLLNRLHGLDEGRRYWRLLLDPWLLSYVATLFDRWEGVTPAFEGHGLVRIRPLPPSAASPRPPLDYAEFLSMAFDPSWNHRLFQDLMAERYADRVVAEPPLQPPLDLPASDPGGGVASLSLRALDEFLRRIPVRHEVVVLGSRLGVSSLARLHLGLGQLPRFYLREFYTRWTRPPVSGDSRDPFIREDMELDWQGSTPFERWLAARIPADLPTSVVEHLPDLRSEAEQIDGLRPKVIVSATDHWDNLLVKVWMAGQSSRGVRIVTVEHGGSLPPAAEGFDFERGVADVRATWFEAHEPDDVQMPPLRLVGGALRTEGDPAGWISIIGNECPPWVYRAQFYPMVDQWYRCFDMVRGVVGGLSSEARELVRIKPYPSDQGWDSRARFADEFGEDVVVDIPSLNMMAKRSRLLLCTYPETAFSAAMTAGVPCVLVYPPEYYELHPVAEPLLARLVDAGIVFHDADAAARHVESIWRDPATWWRHPLTRQATEAFRTTALDLRGRWRRRWTRFLKNLSSAASGGV